MVRGSSVVLSLVLAVVVAVQTASLSGKLDKDYPYDDEGVYDEKYVKEEYKCDEECYGLAKISGFLAGGLALLLLITLADPTYGRKRTKRSGDGDVFEDSNGTVLLTF